jgi:hypothetical protein
MLEVVEQQQRVPLAKVLEQRLARALSRPLLDPELADDRPRDDAGVVDAGELDDHGIIERGRRLEREPRLARSGRACERQQPHLVAAEKLPDLPQLARPPHERRRAGL